MAIECRGICKSFGGKKVLRRASLTLKEGGIYCLMGPSGMGKTTLLRILLGFEQADEGEITGVRPEEISAMFQEDRLLMQLTAEQNVALVYKGRADRRALRRDMAQILPPECLGQPASELSGGMKRRVALVRALHFPGRMVVLDEPFTGLDHDTKEQVIAWILEHLAGRTLLVATHGLDDAELLGAQIIRLDECQDIPEEERLRAAQSHTDLLHVRETPDGERWVRLPQDLPQEQYDEIAAILQSHGGHSGCEG